MANDKKSGPIRIVIADDHSIVREGLRLILSTDKEFEVIGQAANGEEAFDMALQLHPDILLLDVDMPRMTGLETLRNLSQNESPVKAIVLTASINNKQIVEALQLGARGVIRKETPPRVLLKCIHSVFEGQYWLGQNAFTDLIRGLQSLNVASPEQAKFGLTAKELKVIEAVLEGDTNKAIAERLSISEQTVKNHLTNIFNKIGVSNRLELALFAAKHELKSES
jgi:two-component system, NarL family, nitrate/nitrite response regulator NarL